MAHEMTRDTPKRDERSLPQYLGQEVEQSFLDYIVSTYRGAYEAAHPEHLQPMEDDVAIIAALEAAEVRGGPDADTAARTLADPETTELPPALGVIAARLKTPHTRADRKK
jgi:hypothetical protein